jgi:hypothetical protein
MKQPWRAIVAVAALLTPPLSTGDANDFARGRVVQIDPASPAQRILLPQDVYEWSVGPDLGDVRVLNGSSDEVPYALRRPSAAVDHSAWQPLPVFMLPRPGAGPTAQVRIEVAEDGAVVAVHGTAPAADALRAHLIDTGTTDRGRLQLRLSWPDGNEDFVARLRVEASADLDRWQTVSGATTVAQLRAGEEAVRLDLVEAPGGSGRYLRLVQTDGASPLRLTAVAGRLLENRPPERAWKRLAGGPIKGGYEFDTGGRFPVDRVRAGIDQDTYLVRARLSSRARPDDRWRDHGVHTFFRVAAQSTEAEADPAPVGAGTDRWWRLEWDDATTAEPWLAIGWIPHELLFLSQGEPPFLLAYGRGGVSGRSWPMADLLDRLGATLDANALSPASLEAPRLLGGPDRLRAPARAIDWQTILLWTLLCLGVALIGILAFRLMRTGGERAG